MVVQENLEAYVFPLPKTSHAFLQFLFAEMLLDEVALALVGMAIGSGMTDPAEQDKHDRHRWQERCESVG